MTDDETVPVTSVPSDVLLNFCACMGPMGDDPVCPCSMRRLGLKPWTEKNPINRDELRAALEQIMRREEGIRKVDSVFDWED